MIYWFFLFLSIGTIIIVIITIIFIPFIWLRNEKVENILNSNIHTDNLNKK